MYTWAFVYFWKLLTPRNIACLPSVANFPTQRDNHPLIIAQSPAKRLLLIDSLLFDDFQRLSNNKLKSENNPISQSIQVK